MVQNPNTVKLFGPVGSIQVRKCLAVANISRVTIGQADVKPNDDKKKPFNSVSPLLVYPALKTAGGTIVGSNAIIDFLASSDPLARLCGRDCFERGMIMGAVETCSNTLEVFLHKKLEKGDATLDSEVEKYLHHIESVLERKTFLVGERRTYADVAISIVVKHAEEAGFSLPTPVTRWMNTILSDPRVAKALAPQAEKKVAPKKTGNAVAETATAVAETPAVEETSAPSGASDADIKKAAEFNMGHSSLKAMAATQHPKVPAPLNTVSEGGINLEVWKREFSNAKSPEDYKTAFANFWTQFNTEDYTLWKMVYDKYEGEGTVDYLTTNLMNGFVQACDPAARKTTFGVVNTVGANGDFNFEALFLMRGTDMPEWMQQHRSFDYQFFAKIDASTDEMKQFVQEFWTSEESLFGRPIISRVQFK